MVPLDEYPHAYDTASLHDAVRLMDTSQIQFDDRLSMPRVLLVFDGSNNLLGLVRRRDILRGLEPDFHTELEAIHPEVHLTTDIDPNLSDLASGDDTASIRHRLDKPLSSVVKSLVSSVDVDDSLMKIVRQMVGDDTHIIAVIDDGDVIGVARSLDVLRAVCEGLD